MDAGDFIAPQQGYVVKEADVSIGYLDAVADYADGIAHLATHGTASGAVDISTPYEDVVLEVSKTAEPEFDVEFTWTIEKTVDPAVWNLFDGDSGTSDYEVTVTKSEPIESNFRVSGIITIHNPALFASANITTITDVIGASAADFLDSDPPGLPDVFPILLGPDGTLTCSYSEALDDGSDGTNTATVETSPDADNPAGGDVGGSEGIAPFSFAGVEPTDTTTGSINVTDTFPGEDFGPVSLTTIHTYSRTFPCGGEGGDTGVGNEHLNTATIVETGDSDIASVTVNCYVLEVTKTADESFDRQWFWDIDKVADPTSLTLSAGESGTIDYTVTVSVDDAAGVPSGWAVEGDITVSNSAPIDATINSVSDVVPGDIDSPFVDCGEGAFPRIILAGNDLDCTYSADTDGAAGTNTATAVQQNFDYDSLGVALPEDGGTTDYSGDAPVSFADVEPTETDRCVEVSDNKGPIALGGVLDESLCAEDAPGIYEYSLIFGPTDGPETDVPADCGADFSYLNTARFDSLDSEAFGEDPAIVDVVVICPDVGVEKTADSSPINAGEDAEFTITVTNHGPGTATDVTLNDPLPGSGWLITGGTGMASCVDPIAGDILSCDFGDMAEDAILTVEVSRPTTVEDCGTLPNTATVAASNEIDPDVFENEDSATIVVDCPDITVLKTALSSPVQGATGVPLEYTIRVTNLGPGTAFGVTVEDDLASDTTPDVSPWTLLTVSPPGVDADCSINAADVLTCTFASMDDGDFIDIEVRSSATTDPVDCGTTHNNLVRVDAENEDPLKLDNNEDTANIKVECFGPRMTGGGSVFTSLEDGDSPAIETTKVNAKGPKKDQADPIRVTHGFEIHCDPRHKPNRLEINWKDDTGAEHKFHLFDLTSNACFETDLIQGPAYKDGVPPSESAEASMAKNFPFDTFVGRGCGRYDNVPDAWIDFVFTDSGEPGVNDTAIYRIYDANGDLVLKVGTSNFGHGRPDSAEPDPLTQDGAKDVTRGNHQVHKDHKFKPDEFTKCGEDPGTPPPADE